MGGDTHTDRGENYGRRDRGTEREKEIIMGGDTHTQTEEIIMGGETEAHIERRK